MGGGGMNIGTMIMPWTAKNEKGKHSFKSTMLAIADPFGLAHTNRGNDYSPEQEEQGASPSDDLNAAQEAAALQAKEAQDKKRVAMARSRTVYSSPLGVNTQAQTANKTLLGN